MFNTKYFYDANGNQTTKAVMASEVYDGASAGHTVSGDTNEYIAIYDYNCYNQLVGADTNGVVSSYAYLPDGMRLSKTVDGNTTTFVYDGANIVEEITADGVNKYYRGIEIIKNDDNLYYLYNGQGDVAILTDNAGNIVANYIFDAYGNTDSENNVYNPFGYRGEYADAESGLIYLRARMYDPSTGRFINEDPIRDGLNWYVYCENNPVMFVDPWGLAVTKWDIENLSRSDLDRIKKNDKIWSSGNEYQKQIAAESSRQIRQQYLKENEVLLDNGYVLENSQQNISRSILYSEVVVNTCVGYQRLYKEDDIYVKICYVNIDIQTATPRVSVSEICAYIGQASKGCETQIHTGKTYANSYTYSCNWGWIIDYGTESMTTAGAVIDIAIQRGTAKYTMTIHNQLYSTSYFVNGKIQRENFSGFDALSDVLQRPERVPSGR